MKANGFSLIEVLVATAIVMGGVATLAQLFVVSGDATRVASGTSVAVLLAQQKMEDLRAAPGSFGVSPPGALAADTEGFVDYLDAAGGLLAGAGAAPMPAGTLYIRRWSIHALTAGILHVVVFHVLVMPAHGARAGDGIVRLVSVRRQQED